MLKIFNFDLNIFVLIESLLEIIDFIFIGVNLVIIISE